MLMHCCLSVRGVLMNWSDQQFKGVFKSDDGTPLSAREAKETLLDELSKGHEVIPFGPACEGFDYSGGGCPGHADATEPRA